MSASKTTACIREAIAELMDKLPDGLHVRYVHMRVPTLVSNMKMDGIYTSKWNPRGGETVAIIENDKNIEVSRGVACCNPADSYNKNIGRVTALARALKGLDDGGFPTGVYGANIAKPKVGFVGTKRPRPIEVSDDRPPIEETPETTLPEGAHHYSEGASGA